MYQQSLLGNVAIWLLVILVVIGVLLGLSWANLPHQIADAHGTEVNNQYTEELNQLNLKTQKAQTESEIARMQIQKYFLPVQQLLALNSQYEANTQMLKHQADMNAEELANQKVDHTQDLANKDRQARLTEILLTGVAITIGGAVLIVSSASAIVLLRRSAVKVAVQTADPWQSTEIREHLRQLARANERLERQLDYTVQPKSPSTHGPNGQRKYDDLPLVV